MFFLFVLYFPLLLDFLVISSYELDVRFLLIYMDVVVGFGLIWYFFIFFGVHLFYFLIVNYWVGVTFQNGLISRRFFFLLVDLCAVIYLYSISIEIFPASYFSHTVSFVGKSEFLFYAGTAFLVFSLFYCSSREKKHRWVVFVLIGVFSSAYLATNFSQNFDEYKSNEERRNVIVIGVDSLSAYAIENFPEEFPAITALIQSGSYYERAYTPIGRTYPAWVSIVTGLEVADHKAYFNLLDRSESKGIDNLYKKLSINGYWGGFAMDERRFNNMGSEFGFDDVIGPKTGALDFFIHKLTDNPLLNLFLQWPGSKFILPWSWNNVAAYSSYSDAYFVREVVSRSSVNKPVLLSVHFQSGHFPFNSRHARADFEHHNLFFEKYIRSLKVVDRQINELLIGLRHRRVLDNALVVLLSDHGESLGVDTVSDNINPSSNGLMFNGHGVDLLSDHQNRVPLSFVVFDDGKPVSKKIRISDHVNIKDVRDVVEEFVFTGELHSMPVSECFIVETGIRINSTLVYDELDELEVVRDAAYLYDLMDGHLVIKDDFVSKLLLSKDVGLRCSDRVTWYSSSDDEYYSVSLNERGESLEVVRPDFFEIKMINDYRERYLSYYKD